MTQRNPKQKWFLENSRRMHFKRVVSASPRLRGESFCHIRVCARILVLLTLAGCAGVQPAGAPPPESSNSYVKLPSIENGLSISAPDVTSDGRFAKVRGRVTNPYAEEVDGIRYLVRIETRGDQPRTLDRFQHETSERVAPHGSTMLRLDVESMYFGSASQLSIIALPKKLGENAVAPPPEWK